MSPIRATILALALLLAAFGNTNAQTCGGAGYDVSAAAVDMSITTSTNTWYLHPCGSVSAATSATCGNTTAHPYGAMLCQVPIGSSTATVAAVWNSTVATSASVQWLVLSNGIQLSVQDGDWCSTINAPREATVQFICNTTATTPWFASIVQTESCWFTTTVHTSSACNRISTTASNQVGSSFYSNQCGGGIYDLSSLNEDFYYIYGNYRYWVHPCGTVTNTSCNSTQPTSFCQYRNDASAIPVDVSHWNASEAQIWTVTPNGLSVNIRDGVTCSAIGSGVPRQATILFNCNPYITAPILSYVLENEAVIQTPLVCSASNQPALGYCGGAGYDLTAIQNYNLWWNGTQAVTGNQYFFSPCGTIDPANTNGCAGKQSMLCQLTTSGSTSLGSWNASVAQTGVTWVALTSGNGVQYSVQDGDYCSSIGAFRETTVQLICNTAATTPYISAIIQTETCWFTVTVQTTYACFAVGPKFSTAVGSSYYSTHCGGGLYDFTNIAAQGDIMFDTGSNWWFLNMCGQVQTANCSSVRPTSLCWHPKNNSTGGAFSAALMNETTQELYTINSNGMTMSMQDGTPCDGVGYRQASIQIICDGTTPAVITSIRAVETCHYTVTLRAQCNAGVTPPYVPSSSSSTGGNGAARSSSSGAASRSSSAASSVSPAPSSSTGAPAPSQSTGGSTGSAVNPGDDNSSSSSLSGGAIAGIVIGSIVGVAILLALLALFCCGQLGRGAKKTSSDAGSYEHQGNETGHEESQHHAESEIEMEEQAAAE